MLAMSGSVWGYLSGRSSRSRSRNANSLSHQSSCCISETTADGSPIAGLAQSSSFKDGASTAASSEWQCCSVAVHGGASAAAASQLLSPMTASSVVASSTALFSPTTVGTELQAASLRDSVATLSSAWTDDTAPTAAGPAAAAAASPDLGPPEEGAAAAAAPLSEWQKYTTPSQSRQPTRDQDVGGQSPVRMFQRDC